MPQQQLNINNNLMLMYLEMGRKFQERWRRYDGHLPLNNCRWLTPCSKQHMVANLLVKSCLMPPNQRCFQIRQTCKRFTEAFGERLCNFCNHFFQSLRILGKILVHLQLHSSWRLSIRRSLKLRICFSCSLLWLPVAMIVWWDICYWRWMHIQPPKSSLALYFVPSIAFRANIIQTFLTHFNYAWNICGIASWNTFRVSLCCIDSKLISVSILTSSCPRRISIFKHSSCENFEMRWESLIWNVKQWMKQEAIERKRILNINLRI